MPDAAVFRPDLAEPGLQADQRRLDRGWLRIGLGLLVVGQTMALGLAVNLTPPDGAAYWFLHGGLILSAAAALIFLGGDLVGGAVASLRQRRISIDLLFLLTLGGAFGGSLVATFTHTGAVYYEVVAILIVVHTAGRMLGARSRLAALRAVDRTRERFEVCEIRGPDGGRLRRPVGEVGLGDTVLVAPGAPICVDGTVTAGRGYVQETSMTGEWRPVSRGPGDRVLAGTFSIDGTFELRPVPGPRRLDAVLAAVAEAHLAPSALQRQADRLVEWFLPTVATVSLATFGFWILRAPWNQALFNAMAVLLVACPCAMGLATPVAVWGGLARLAGFGLVTRTGDFLDALARCDFVCLDKTGTLSTESLAVRAWRTEPAFAGRESWLRAAVAAAEEGLAHPVAAVLRRGDAAPGSRPVAVRERRLEPGLGIVAQVAGEAGAMVELRVGERRLIEPAAEAAGESEARAVWVGVDGRRAAVVELGETWREGLGEALAELRALDVEFEVLTGDASFAAGRGPEPQLAVRAGLTPEAKLARVRELAAAGRCVAFVGDGINDAAAMSAAAASVAMAGGAELARAAAMAVFAGRDLRFLPRAIRVARAARRSVRVNLLFAAAYNTAGMALAAAGLLHPVAAALLMVGSSAFVSANALRSVGRAEADAGGPAGALRTSGV
ncbi:MAG TPA: heavy metal translocating P-type ATPase [Opitutaceae bacterium]|nr:heavy metal translocating P-type ATPase [Opitutaceae bacterium]